MLLDFFVDGPGPGGVERRSELVPIPVYFSADVAAGVQRRRGVVRGAGDRRRGSGEALRRFGSVPMAELVARPRRLARERGSW